MSKKLVLIQIFLIFILPVFLLYFEIVALEWRIPLLAISSLLIYGIIRREHWTYEKMGLSLENLKESFPFYLFFTLLGIILLLSISDWFNFSSIGTKEFLIRTWSFFIPISFFQEFAFRSFLIPRLQIIYHSNFWVVLINAILFTLIHIIYPNWGISLPLAFFSGIYFAWIYLRHPNLLLISISHSILNVIAILLGFFNLP